MPDASHKRLSLEARDLAHATVLRVSGSADMAAAEELREGLQGLVDRQVPLIVIDLSELEFIGSMGLGAIVWGHLRSRHHQGEIRLVSPRPAVRQMLEITCLTKVFPIYETVEQAVAG